LDEYENSGLNEEIDFLSLLSGQQEDQVLGTNLLGKRGNSRLQDSPLGLSRSFKTPSPNNKTTNLQHSTLGNNLSKTPSTYLYTKYGRLILSYRYIVGKTRQFNPQTVQQNTSYATKLQRWFPVPLLIEVLIELHRTDPFELINEEHILARILGYLECSLRIRCRTLPWQAIWDISHEFKMNLSKSLIFDYYLRALSAGAFANFKDWRSNKDTFTIMRGLIVSLCLDLPVTSAQQREILQLAKEFCTFLVIYRFDPEDPELYAHALVELAYMQLIGGQALVTSSNPAFNTMLLSVMDSIHQDLQLPLSA
jgi:hypothetical protein